MHHEPVDNVPPPFPEFPGAIAAAFFVAAAVILIAPIQDRYIFSAILAGIGLGSGVIALMTWRRMRESQPSTDPTAHH